ncbi:hypothetical protein AHAS_Ahas15G0270700 [Arachis hypogaea]
MASGYQDAFVFFYHLIDQLLEVCRQKALWNTIWDLRCSPTIKNFVWKLLYNGSQVRQWFHDRFLNIKDRCPRCREEGESIIHCLVHCIDANQTWQRMTWPW